jgi:hypothetical protein
MRDSSGRMVVDHGSNLGGGRYSLTTSTLVAGKVNSFLYVRNDDVAEVWINGVSQGSKPVDNNLPTDSTTLPFSIGVMVGNDNYRSALGFNALFFYGRALTVHERTLMIAYSKKEYESIDPVELPAQVSSAEKTARTGTAVRSFSPKDIADMDINGGSSTTLPPEITDSQVTHGFGATPVLVTPTKLKTFTGLHSSGLVPSFETVISNMMGWDVLSRGYIADPSDSTKKVLSAVTLRDPLDSINQVIINYTWNSNGTINKETLDFRNGVFPANVKTTKTYVYQDGRMIRITYT